MKVLKCPLLFLKAAQNPLGFVLHSFVQSLSLRKQTTFRDATNSFPANWRLRNKRRNSILMMRHCPDLGSALLVMPLVKLLQPIRSTTLIWVVTHHQYGISALVSQIAIRGETVGGVAECRLFLQASKVLDLNCYQVLSTVSMGFPAN